MSGFSIFFFFENYYYYFFFYFWPTARITKRFSAAKLRLSILFKFLASRTSLCLGRACWGMRSPMNVVSGTGTRDEPLRTSALEAQPKYLKNVHLTGFSKPLPPNVQQLPL